MQFASGRQFATSSRSRNLGKATLLHRSTASKRKASFIYMNEQVRVELGGKDRKTDELRDHNMDYRGVQLFSESLVNNVAKQWTVRRSTFSAQFLFLSINASAALAHQVSSFSFTVSIHKTTRIRRCESQLRLRVCAQRSRSRYKIARRNSYQPNE